MSKQCEICGKKPIKAAKRTFSNKQNCYRQTPNLQSVSVATEGGKKKMTVCTSCLKAGKVQKKQLKRELILLSTLFLFAIKSKKRTFKLI